MADNAAKQEAFKRLLEEQELADKEERELEGSNPMHAVLNK